MELQDLKLNPTDIRDNIQINGPSTAVKNRDKLLARYKDDAEKLAQFEKLPYSNYTFFLQLPCGPEKVDTLLYAANQEIQNLVKNGPSKENLEKVKQQWKEKYKVDIKENGTWLSQIESFYFPGNNPDYFISYEKYVNALTQKDVQDAAKLFFATNNVVTGILMPEKK